MGVQYGLLNLQLVELLRSLLAQTQHCVSALCTALCVRCNAHKGQSCHLEELVIKTHQELVNIRIADGLCGHRRERVASENRQFWDLCAYFPPLWLSSVIKERTSVSPAAAHGLKLFGMLMSKCTSSCIILRCYCWEPTAFTAYLHTFVW